MDCREFERLSGRLADCEADAEVTRAMEAHASSCDRCAYILNGIVSLGRLHAGLPELEKPAGLTDRIVSRVEASGVRDSGWIWRSLVPAAAAVLVIAGIWAGLHINRTWFGQTGIQRAEVAGLEYLDDYPPDSVGEAIELAAKGSSE